MQHRKNALVGEGGGGPALGFLLRALWLILPAYGPPRDFQQGRASRWDAHDGVGDEVLPICYFLLLKIYVFH